MTRDGDVPLVSHTYPGNRPDVTQFATMIDLLSARHAALVTRVGPPTAAEVTVVFDAGQNSVANFTHLIGTGLAFVGSGPPSDCPDLLALPASDRTLVDADRFAGLTAVQTRRIVYGAERRVILTHSPTLHDAQRAGFAQTMSKAVAKLTDLSDTLARGKTRRSTAQVSAQIASITADPWLHRVLNCELTGATPTEHRLTVTVDTKAQDTLETEVFGKRILLTDREPWSVAEVVAGYRSQSDAEFSFRQLKDPRRVVLPDAPLDRAQHPGTHLHLRARPADRPPDAPRSRTRRPAPVGPRPTRPGIAETVLIYPSTGGVSQSPQHAHRNHPQPRPTHRDLPTSPDGPPGLGSYTETRSTRF